MLTAVDCKCGKKAEEANTSAANPASESKEEEKGSEKEAESAEAEAETDEEKQIDDTSEKSQTDDASEEASETSEAASESEESFEPYDTVIDGNDYTIYPDHAEFLKYNGSGEASFTIPNEADGKPVTIIGRYAFKSSNLKQIMLPDTLEQLDEGCFYDCSVLTDIKLPASLKRIEKDVFTDCASLESLTIPGGIEQCYNFDGAENLKTLVFEEGITYISYFGKNYSLEKVVLPDSVEEIQAKAFSYCSSL